MLNSAKTVLVTGGAGFLGHHVVRGLLRNGWQVRILDVAPFEWNEAGIGPDVILGSFFDTSVALKAIDGVHVLIHLVHTTVPVNSMRDVNFDFISNVAATARVLSILPEGQLKHMVYVSSGGTVYGRARSLPIDESHPTDPMCSYGISKLAIEKYCLMFSELRGFSCTILRPSNAYGPGQNTKRQQGAAGVFLERLLNEQPISIWGDGKIVRDYIYVSDLTEAIVLAAQWQQGSAIWNVSSQEGVSLLDLLRLLESVTGLKATIRFEPAQPWDVPINILSNKRIREALGWRPLVSLRDGLVDMYKALKST